MGNHKYLVVGAHPDDPDLIFGGCAVKLSRQGHTVKFISAVNGDAGHFAMPHAALAARRKKEAQASAKIAGLAAYQILDHHDGELVPTLENRREMIRLIREFSPDVIITHRLCDYHADHRAASQLVQDAAYLLMVPLICPETPIMAKYPIILFSWDAFRKSCPFMPDLAVVIDDSAETKLDMLNCHVSQFYEWLPYNQGRLEQVPGDPLKRREGLRLEWLSYNQRQANLARALLVARHGEAGMKMLYAETFEVSEYGRQPTFEELNELFAF